MVKVYSKRAPQLLLEGGHAEFPFRRGHGEADQRLDAVGRGHRRAGGEVDQLAGMDAQHLAEPDVQQVDELVAREPLPPDSGKTVRRFDGQDGSDLHAQPVDLGIVQDRGGVGHGVLDEAGVEARRGHRAGAQGIKMLPDQRLQRGRLGVARHHEDHALGPIPFVVELPQRLRLGGVDIALDGVAQRGKRVEETPAGELGPAGGRLSVAQLAGDDAALALHLLRVELHAVRDVAQHGEPVVEIRRGGGGRVEDVERVGQQREGAHLRADLHAVFFQVRDEALAGEMRGAVEGHVLDEMRVTALGLGLLGGPDLHGEAEADVPGRLRVPADGVAQAVVEHAPLPGRIGRETVGGDGPRRRGRQHRGLGEQAREEKREEEPPGRAHRLTPALNGRRQPPSRRCRALTDMEGLTTEYSENTERFTGGNGGNGDWENSVCSVVSCERSGRFSVYSMCSVVPPVSLSIRAIRGEKIMRAWLRVRGCRRLFQQPCPARWAGVPGSWTAPGRGSGREPRWRGRWTEKAPRPGRISCSRGGSRSGRRAPRSLADWPPLSSVGVFVFSTRPVVAWKSACWAPATSRRA